jgi:predicted transcriptional regulator
LPIREEDFNDGVMACYVALRFNNTEDVDMTTLTIRLPEQLRADLKKLSRQEHKAVSDIVRESLRRHVAVQQFQALRRRILPFAEAQGLVTDEDVFRALS